MRRLWPRLRYGRECGVPAPGRLADAGPCVIRVRHDEWHADGAGFIWNDHLWAWRGPMVDLAEDLRPEGVGEHDVWAERI